MNTSLKKLNAYKPKEIHRAVRGLDSLKLWKGTELRSFMLYYGIVVLKEHSAIDVYLHFVRLCCAVRICYTDAYAAYRPIAKIWFEQFIEEYKDIYGENSIGSNVHNLIHVFDDLQEFGSLNAVSTYPFENRLQFLKSRLKQRRLPLQQITRRLAELSIDYDQLYTLNPSKPSTLPQLRSPYKIGNTIAFKEIVHSKYIISSVKKDSWFLTVDNYIVSMQYATTTTEGKILIHGLPVKEKSNFFVQPCSSEFLNIYKTTAEMDTLRSFEYQAVKAKMICLPSGENFVCMPLLHTL